MKVDLQEVKACLEARIQQLDQQKAKLLDQMLQIEGAQKIVGGLKEAESRQGDNSQESAASADEGGKKWFKRS